MHHAQTFSGNRYAELRITDHYFGALILYALFAGVFIPYLYIVSNIWTNWKVMHCSNLETFSPVEKARINFENIYDKQKHVIEQYFEIGKYAKTIQPNPLYNKSTTKVSVDCIELPTKITVKRSTKPATQIGHINKVLKVLSKQHTTTKTYLKSVLKERKTKKSVDIKRQTTILQIKSKEFFKIKSTQSFKKVNLHNMQYNITNAYKNSKQNNTKKGVANDKFKKTTPNSYKSISEALKIDTDATRTYAKSLINEIKILKLDDQNLNKQTKQWLTKKTFTPILVLKNLYTNQITETKFSYMETTIKTDKVLKNEFYKTNFETTPNIESEDIIFRFTKNYFPYDISNVHHIDDLTSILAQYVNTISFSQLILSDIKDDFTFYQNNLSNTKNIIMEKNKVYMKSDYKISLETLSMDSCTILVTTQMPIVITKNVEILKDISKSKIYNIYYTEMAKNSWSTETTEKLLWTHVETHISQTTGNNLFHFTESTNTDKSNVTYLSDTNNKSTYLLDKEQKTSRSNPNYDKTDGGVKNISKDHVSTTNLQILLLSGMNYFSTLYNVAQNRTLQNNTFDEIESLDTNFKKVTSQFNTNTAFTPQTTGLKWITIYINSIEEDKLTKKNMSNINVKIKISKFTDYLYYDSALKITLMQGKLTIVL